MAAHLPLGCWTRCAHSDTHAHRVYTHTNTSTHIYTDTTHTAQQTPNPQAFPITPLPAWPEGAEFLFRHQLGAPIRRTPESCSKLGALLPVRRGHMLGSSCSACTPPHPDSSQALPVYGKATGKATQGLEPFC